MPDLIIWLISAAVLLLGCWIQTALGFGMAVVAAPVIVLIEPRWVPVVLTFTALPLCAINAWNQRDALEIRTMIVPLITRIPGTSLGAWLLVQLDITGLRIMVSLCVLLAVVITWFSGKFTATPSHLGWAGFFSGITGTTTSIGGPPMALVMQHGNPRTVRANISLFFTYGCIVSIIGYTIAGILSIDLLIDSLSFLPCTLIGFYYGIRLRGYVDGDRFRPLILGLCTVAALVALVGAIY